MARAVGHDPAQSGYQRCRFLRARAFRDTYGGPRQHDLRLSPRPDLRRRTVRPCRSEVDPATPSPAVLECALACVRLTENTTYPSPAAGEERRVHPAGTPDVHCALTRRLHGGAEGDTTILHDLRDVKSVTLEHRPSSRADAPCLAEPGSPRTPARCVPRVGTAIAGPHPYVARPASRPMSPPAAPPSVPKPPAY